MQCRGERPRGGMVPAVETARPVANARDERHHPHTPARGPMPGTSRKESPMDDGIEDQGPVTQVRVYHYTAERGADLDEAGMAQLRLAHELRNRLVEIEMACEEARLGVWANHPEMAAAEAAVTAAETAVAVARDLVAADKKTRRGPAEASLRAGLSTARSWLRETKTARKQSRDVVRDVLRPVLRALEDDRRAVIKAEYAVFCQERGLYWATFNHVTSSFEVSRKRMIADRLAGKPAQLRFHRWTGEGTLTVQLQRDKTAPPRHPGTMPGSRWRNMIELPHMGQGQWAGMSRVARKDWARDRTPGRGINPGRTFRMRIGADGQSPVWLTVPVVWHRPIPDDADICVAQVTRRVRPGRKPELTVAVTVKLPAPHPATGATAAVDLGWRSVQDGLRVAVITADAPVPDVPAGSWLRKLGPETVELIIPQATLDALERSEKIRGLRDDKLNILRGWLLDRRDLLPELEGVDYQTMPLWRSPARFASLAIRWRALERDPQEHRVFEVLEGWRRQDKHLLLMGEGQTARRLRGRREAFRVTAAWLTKFCGRVVFEQIDLDRMSRVPDVAEDDGPQARRARWQQQVAAPGEFRAAVCTTAAREGVMVETVNPAWSTLVHRSCGRMLDRDQVRDRVVVPCECGALVDQDVNASMLLLEAVSPVVAWSAGGVRRADLLLAGARI